MRRIEAVLNLLPKSWGPVVSSATAFAPVNIALIKYWGKRDEELYLPVTDSLSLTLAEGTTTTICQHEEDTVVLNGRLIERSSVFYQRLVRFLDLFRPSLSFCFSVSTQNTVPTAAGLASSASGFAALVLALNKFFGWNLDRRACSVLARLGSGSACRSVYPGFVHWLRGNNKDGSDSYAVPLSDQWPDLRLAACIVKASQKPISSTEAMRRTVLTSSMYRSWPEQVENDLRDIFEVISTRDFVRFGGIAERNALAMHATMRSADPSIDYWTDETRTILQQASLMRQEGILVFATLDAGPNVKLLYLKSFEQEIREKFSFAKPIDLLWTFPQ